ncbi:YlxR family protein [Corynebacterium pygosceleis]|uniref:YlxR family protein n=1 Tax=Corynebacterium pygosceleis TaxID=2800406 RepID=A0A9Q4C8U9_9CORY|nr:YlxR family protein [Corynebacterium pygosceleis]MCK7636812.1 YlxR family protein [Corynebacterium pygosceleis]MCK7674286.1 YlxR family protein [Corynebacterium pygosceleis]MCL0120416.1 YlxR family protein [Corynebacterium pygosceleis]MCX7443962.1 YlxR family protein [Corynebacterium pygosceleis]MCX7467565.1 YlxR family protein [Corynebacterium pygosceleis]
MRQTGASAEAPAGIRVRTCIATRERRADTQLLRIVADASRSGRLIPDPARRKPGRGAWLTPSLEALELAEKRRAFNRALRVSTPVDTEAVRTWLREHAAEPPTPGKTRTLMSTR